MAVDEEVVADNGTVRISGFSIGTCVIARFVVIFWHKYHE